MSGTETYVLPNKVIRLTSVDTLGQFDVIIDTRPFKLYSGSHLKNSINVYLPTTLLKRESYCLENVLTSADVPSETRKLVLDTISGRSDKKVSVLMYDSNSSEDQIHFHLYQMLLKFHRYKDMFNIYFLNGGYDGVHNKTEVSDYSTKSPPISPSKSSMSISGIQLPPSTSFQEKFVSSVKKNNLPRLDIASIIENSKPSDKSSISNFKTRLASKTCPSPCSNYHHDIKYPQNYEKYKEHMPKWLRFMELRDKEIIEMLDKKFDKIEKLEEIRLGQVVSDKTPDHIPNICSPNGLCPSCDFISYKMPKGIEYGFKNRYHNIWPYEHSRVKLTHSSNDYFNASHIDNYIATQSPLQETFEDFWKIVLLNNIGLVVCLNYSPFENSYYADAYFKDSNVEIKSIEKTENKAFTIRKIKITKGNEKTHYVYHLLYKEWPDFGVPDNFSSLIDLLDTKDKLISTHNLNSKIMVNCSAGCGRTGVFIALDMAIRKFKDGDATFWEDDDIIYKAVHYQRTQRLSMVQTFDQYIVCYEVLLQYLVNMFEHSESD